MRRKMVTGTVTGLLMLMMAPQAMADIKAVYATVDRPGSPVMTLEVDDSGNARLTESDHESYLLLRDGIVYMVDLSKDQPIVGRMEDIYALASAAGEKTPAADFMARLQLVERGPATINGREGRVYGYDSGKEGPVIDRVLVISQDPKLAPLGKALAAMETGDSRYAVARAPLRTLLLRGGPIFYDGRPLQSVEDTEIADGRFTLPARAPAPR